MRRSLGLFGNDSGDAIRFPVTSSSSTTKLTSQCVRLGYGTVQRGLARHQFEIQLIRG